MPRTRNLAIFVPTTMTTTMKTTDGQTDCFTPCACVRGNEAAGLDKLQMLVIIESVYIDKGWPGYAKN